jgi:hypothetical protein
MRVNGHRELITPYGAPADWLTLAGAEDAGLDACVPGTGDDGVPTVVGAGVFVGVDVADVTDAVCDELRGVEVDAGLSTAVEPSAVDIALGAADSVAEVLAGVLELVVRGGVVVVAATTPTT